MSQIEIGSVVGGGYQTNLKVELCVSSEEVQIGSFIRIQGRLADYFGIVTDLQHAGDDIPFARHPGRERLPYPLSAIVEDETLHSSAEIQISLVKGREKGSSSLVPSRSLPAPLSPVFLADQTDIETLLGQEDHQHFIIGYTREQFLPVPLDLNLLVQRSSGVFGATGTGKSFLVRLLLAGLIDRNIASTLVFDLHNEYALNDIATDARRQVPGLKPLFPAQVQVFGLGEHTQIRGIAPDRNLLIRLSDIRPEDVRLLADILDLNESAGLVMDVLVKKFGPMDWLRRFRDLVHGSGTDEKAHPTVAQWAKETGINGRSAEALHSKLLRIVNRPYVDDHCRQDGIGEIIHALENGQTVILSFAKFDQELDYLLIANVLMRRVREAWERRADAYRATLTQAPRPLVVVLEEAHRFLNPRMAGQTAFGQIAREMRKSYLTMLIVDQRPSGIYDEVLSQLGTRICGWLGDDDDIRSVLAGLAGREGLKALLANLRPTQEALMVGWGVPLPITIRVRDYDDAIGKILSK